MVVDVHFIVNVHVHVLTAENRNASQLQWLECNCRSGSWVIIGKCLGTRLKNRGRGDRGKSKGYRLGDTRYPDSLRRNRYSQCRGNWLKADRTRRATFTGWEGHGFITPFINRRRVRCRLWVGLWIEENRRSYCPRGQQHEKPKMDLGQHGWKEQ